MLDLQVSLLLYCFELFVCDQFGCKKKYDVRTSTSYCAVRSLARAFEGEHTRRQLRAEVTQYLEVWGHGNPENFKI